MEREKDREREREGGREGGREILGMTIGIFGELITLAAFCGQQLFKICFFLLYS